jgi:hypothetical protein
MSVVGLYRDIYGIQPKHNRLYLEPHLTAELGGTRLRYQLRGQLYLVDLDLGASRLTVDDFGVAASEPFAVNAKGETIEFFAGKQSTPALAVTRSRRAPLDMTMEACPSSPTGARKWTESASGRGVTARHLVSGLQPKASYELRCDGRKAGSFTSDAGGRIEFKLTLVSGKPQRLELGHQ